VNLIGNGVLQLGQLSELLQRPPFFEPAEQFIWDDAYIATQMLIAHLDPNTEAASRHPEIDLAPGNALLDLGCGPGLYCQRLSARGLDVTGVDLSQNSISYAREHDPATIYICKNYLEFELTGSFKAITLIYGDFCVLSDANRDKLLGKIHEALDDDGHFVFDVMAMPIYQARRNVSPTWSVEDGAGFWKPGAHLVLAQHFDYPEQTTVLEQFIIVEEDGAVSVYRNWHRYYSAEAITAVLENCGFEVAALHGDLTGTAYTSDSEWIGVVTQKG
jgi:SAM-dependent methyltransferase